MRSIKHTGALNAGVCSRAAGVRSSHPLGAVAGGQHEPVMAEQTLLRLAERWATLTTSSNSVCRDFHPAVAGAVLPVLNRPVNMKAVRVAGYCTDGLVAAVGVELVVARAYVEVIIIDATEHYTTNRRWGAGVRRSNKGHQADEGIEQLGGDWGGGGHSIPSPGEINSAAKRTGGTATGGCVQLVRLAYFLDDTTKPAAFRARISLAVKFLPSQRMMLSLRKPR
jgi:hypothetical protein